MRAQEGHFAAEGIRLVEDLLSSPLEIRFVIHSSSVGDTPRGAALLDRARQSGVRIEEVEQRDFAEIADTQNPQGVLAVAGIPTTRLEEIELAADGPAGLLVLDAVQDPGNFGTLVRTAEALGAAGVLLLPGTVDPWNAKAVRAAMGASFRLPVVSVSWQRALPWLRAAGFRIVASAADGDPRIPAAGKVALVVGNEGNGISSETRAIADEVVAIPLRGRSESLNVAAAAAILLHALLG